MEKFSLIYSSLVLPGQYWLEAVLEKLGIVWVQVELLWVMSTLQVPVARQVVLCRVHHKVAELAVEEGEQQGNQIGSHLMDSMMAEEVHYL